MALDMYITETGNQFTQATGKLTKEALKYASEMREAGTEYELKVKANLIAKEAERMLKVRAE